jgi:ParB family chromosome partitioning protein
MAMAEEATKLRLGRGLAALIGDVDDESAVVERARGARKVPVEFLRPNPRNPRRRFDESETTALAVSIRERGIVQPIVVRPLPHLPDAYEIVAGERRWRAAQVAGLHAVPVVVVDLDDKASLEFAILENVQRLDLNAIEEAQGYERLMQEFGYSHGELSSILGKSRSHVTNILRLLNLPASVQELVTGNLISAGHARALLAVQDPEAVAKRIHPENLSVREVEEIAYAEHGNADPKILARRGGRPAKDPDTRAVERALEDVLGLKVTIAHRGEGGDLRIRYASLEQLDGLCRKLKEAAGR